MGDYFHLFQTRQDEINYVNEHGVSDPYISYIESEDKVKWDPNEESKTSYSYSLGQYLHVTGEVNDTASSDVIGVCVIPSNFVPDKKARFVSLPYMSASSNTGTTSGEGIQWSTDTSSTILPKQYNRVPVDSNMNGILSGSNDWGRLPMERSDTDFSVFNNRVDPITRYYKNIEADGAIPSPYNISGDFEENYIKNISGYNNALTDFDGKNNTSILVTNGTCPAASACAAFSPGYKNGSWYLPAMGELGFIAPRISLINSKISSAVSSGAFGVSLSLDYGFWSSSEYSSDYAWGLDTSYGDVYYDGKTSGLLVRSFLAI